MPCPSTDSKFVFCILKFLKHAQFFMNTQYGNMACGVFKRGTVGGIAHICSKQWFQITADAHPGVSGVSKDKIQIQIQKYSLPGRPSSQN